MKIGNTEKKKKEDIIKSLLHQKKSKAGHTLEGFASHFQQ